MVLPLHRSIQSSCVDPFDPRAFLPMLAQRARTPDRIPAGWAIERLWDGTRVIAALGGDVLCLVGRGGRDLAPDFPELAALVDVVEARDWVLDGEVVCVDEHGRGDQTSLVSRLRGGRTTEPVGCAIRYVAYDLLVANGIDVRGRPWRERRGLLEEIATAGGPLLLSRPSWEDAATVLGSVAAEGIDGIVGRNPDAPYRSGMRPPNTWIEVLARRHASFVVVGWTPLSVGGRRDDSRVGALHLAARLPDGTLRDAGKVGSGMDDATRRALAVRLAGTTTPLVVDVEFASWTAEGRLRHPCWRAVRDDLDPDHLVTEID